MKERLKEFRDLHKGKDEDIFSELCFCILTPQSKAVNSDRAIKELKKSGLLFKGNRRAVRARLKGVRFPNNKSAFLIYARKVFKDGKGVNVKCRLNPDDIFTTREWLVKNVKGIGYKEASHFLRNIGLGKDLAILDVHILKNLKRYKVIDKIPPSLSRKTYLDIEDRMREFCKKIKIPMEEIDLLFWSRETGIIFK
ncbi:MAG: N-glycosylase/DNA lyase [Candidatus Omnitrophica bacterium]|nr:N-glycosylase/DNA lyase [Candidatus Omnitrophota bacterium]